MWRFNNHNGFTIVQAIFVLVVLGMLGTYMVTLSTVQQGIATQSLLQARAYQSARSGLEWGVKSVTDNSACFAPATFTLDSYSITVSCVAVGNYDEAGTTYNVYNLGSVASYADISSPDYVSRTLEVTIHD